MKEWNGKMQYISGEMIENNISMREIIEAVKKAFSMAEKGLIDAPLRTVIPAEKGSLLFMPAYSRDLGLAVLKNVNVFPGNEALGLSTTPAEILLIDATTGYTRAVLDGTVVTRLRTGGASGAAFDLLAKKDCPKGALFGTGGQAEAQLDAMLTVRNPQEVSIYSLHPAHREAFTDRMRTKYADRGIRFSCAASPEECAAEADLIITATTAETPVFDGSLVKKGATVSAVGTYEPGKQELDSGLIARADKIFCDFKEAVLSESGDLLIPLAQGVIAPEDICGGLGEVINGDLPGRESDDEIIVFKSVGIAAQDLLTAGMICEKLNNFF